MRNSMIIFAALVALFISQSAYANSFNTELLKNEVITAKAETERHIWIGTTTGVWQINKRNNKMVKYTSANSMLPSDKVSGICVGQYGQVYIGTDRGIMHYDNYAMLVINTDNSGLPSNNITSIVSDNDNVIWLGTADKGLVKMYNGKCKVYNTSNSDIASNAITFIEKDAAGQIIVHFERDTMVANNMQMNHN